VKKVFAAGESDVLAWHKKRAGIAARGLWVAREQERGQS
jgi:hypothetical protein